MKTCICPARDPMPGRVLRKAAGCLSAIILFHAHLASCQSNSVEIWMKAFIPDQVNSGTAAGFIVAIPNGPGSMVKLHNFSGSLPNSCYATDNRGFDSKEGSTFRLETKFTLRLSEDGKSATVTPVSARTRAGLTRKIDCATGAVTDQKQGSVDRDDIGHPAVADGRAQVIGQISGRNLLTVLGDKGPAIDYSFDIQWRPSNSQLAATITYGSFPAFEMYARQGGGSWTPVLRRIPSGQPFQLAGDSFGVNSANGTATVIVKGMQGRWISPPPDQRFTIEIFGSTARWTERNSAGAVLARDVILKEQVGGTFRMERLNDAEVLAFLGFQTALKGEILAAGPRPSFMVLSWEGSHLRADWSGLLVIKDEKAHLKQLVQPGEKPPKSFSLIQ